MQFQFVKKESVGRLPTVPGVYAFKSKKGVLLYIGKAVNIRDRVKNHFSQPTFKDNIFIPATEKIGYITTGSEIEALISEADLIKKYQPHYNTQWKDNKNYFYVAITQEAFPRIFVTHQIDDSLIHIGPFVDSKAIKQTLRVLRRIFPYRTCRVMPKKPCLYYDLNLCPAPCGQFQDKKQYKKNIQNLIKILRGKKMQVLKDLQKEMQLTSQKQEFEKAKTLRDQTMSLENVFQHSHILEKEERKPTNWPKAEAELKKLLDLAGSLKRIEGYDISNIQGQQATGSMVVFEKGLPNKNEYRKFKIRITGKPNDTAMIKEMLARRLKHPEWPRPQIILIDGGKGQLNAALSQVKKIKVISLAKRLNELFIENHKKPVLLKSLSQDASNLILHLRDEAHRFAVSYHRKLRTKSLLP
ncbi:MAG: GIY-YIG nuclease family protein [Candidatus Pacebacteria bacterium]|nr:GIY-YIG nuclease family protein [Candidatus Paceibacterota bacterium]